MPSDPLGSTRSYLFIHHSPIMGRFNPGKVPMQPILTMQEVTKSFGHVEALKDVSLDIYPGEILGLLGDNGAGKSTLIKIISGVYRADHGKFTYKGEEVSLSSPIRRAEDGYRHGLPGPLTGRYPPGCPQHIPGARARRLGIHPQPAQDGKRCRGIPEATEASTCLP